MRFSGSNEGEMIKCFLVTLYDRYHQVYLMRFSLTAKSLGDQPEPGVSVNMEESDDLHNVVFVGFVWSDRDNCGLMY
jgi:hypothetical protein